MTSHQPKLVHVLEQQDSTWAQLRREAEAVARREPELATLITMCILHEDGLEAAIVHCLARRLDNQAVPGEVIRQTYRDALRSDERIGLAMRADLAAVVERDPAASRLIDPVLFFKGFHAIQTHRLAHWLWLSQRCDFARYLQSRSSEVFQTDIHPAVPFGRGVFLDHATGLVVGETAVIEDDVSILQGVTLGGTGKETGDRHPKIRRGVLIGAGAKVLGNIEVGPCARIGAGSVVVRPVAPRTTVAGIPAKPVGTTNCADPARVMDQMIYDVGL